MASRRFSSISYLSPDRVTPDISRIKHWETITQGDENQVATEEAIEAYLVLNEWQTNGIIEAIAEADSPDAHWTDSEELKAKWEAKPAQVAIRCLE